MTDTVEGWPVLPPGSPLLHTWTLPGIPRRLTLRNGSAGFLLAYVAHWYNERIERLAQPGEAAVDDGGYSYRPITGGTSWSKHATGCAMDLNWHRHPYDTPTDHSFTREQIGRCHNRLHDRYSVQGRPVIEWGGDWPSHPGSTAKTDSMHWQLHNAARLVDAEALARRLVTTQRGRLILDANAGQLSVIGS